ncbi:MAG: UPF0147 family protein [Candidatus Aenigmarchaeota archaeon]|nr:UPF0147 family protein [Candidatus Aenigmarchaeota archaeon]
MGKKEAVISLLDGVIKDRGVPKNVKSSVEEALDILRNPNANNIKIAETVSILDEVTNDPNLSVYTRTVLWDAVSKLEALK